jgi:transposase-like protein
VINCARCGAEQEQASALAWSFEPGPQERWLCPECARRHVREIEAKLAPEWWALDT